MKCRCHTFNGTLHCCYLRVLLVSTSKGSRDMTTDPSSPSPVSFPDFHPTPGRPAFYDLQEKAIFCSNYKEVYRNGHI